MLLFTIGDFLQLSTYAKMR